MRLFIAEKPSLAEAIAKGLGSADKQRSCFVCGNDVVTWCFGHILEQFAPQEYDEKYKSWDIALLPIIPEKWQMPEDMEGLDAEGRLLEKARAEAIAAKVQG